MTDQRFTLEGPPVVQERARKGQYGNWFDPTAKAKEAMSWSLKAQGAKPVKGEVGIEVVFYGAKKADLDNLIKALSDSGNGILWDDDKQVIHIEADVVRVSDRPRTVLCVREIKGELDVK